eukprot:TRINITY_DN4663_c0_g1_i5.p1 TRINITY_DN4663_c0_g1~~TRINITY_DN4663_c0_g1_i5.p1  ORF type:complete len:151 (-),score=22.65 TRINITY_DN4663_c0_g1_i5:245-697(-)
MRIVRHIVTRNFHTKIISIFLTFLCVCVFFLFSVGESLTLCFVLWGIKTGALRCTLSQVITSLQVICGLSCSGSVFAQWILIVVGATSTGLIQRVQAFCKINDKQALSSFQPPPILDGLVERFTVDSQKELQLLFQVEEMNNELARTFRC